MLLEGEHWGQAGQRGVCLFPQVLSLFADYLFRNLPPGQIVWQN